MHPDLFRMINYCHSKGMSTCLYTNGSNLTDEYIERLCYNGLNVLMISYYSFDESEFCLIRQSKELYEKATEALFRLKSWNVEGRLPISIRLQSVLTKLNFASLPELVRFAIDAEFETLSISYLEHAREHSELYMNQDDIDKFKHEVIPKIHKILMDTQKISQKKQQQNGIILNEVFADTYRGELVDINNGQYRSVVPICINEDKYMVIEADGEVMPCCGVEYYEKSKSFGNIYTKDLQGLLGSEEFNGFWKVEKEMCKFCAVDRHFFLFTS